MQIVIDLPNDVYKDIKEGDSIDYLKVFYAIEDGTPFDKIRAEIDLETRIQVKHYTNTDAVINEVLDVIDKYKAKSEEKE